MEQVTAKTVKAWLSDEQELAFIDVREHGQYGEAHPFFVSSVPFSRFETLLPDRVPNPAARMVLVDGGDGVALRAAKIAQGLGYNNLHVLEGGTPAWQAASYTLYSGVNVPSKTFAEIMELERHTPAMTAQAVADLKQDGVKHVILDGRPLTEFSKFSIPGAVCCPNGELAMRIGEFIDDAETTVVVNCAGRTRSIIGAQTLIDVGLKNPVYALENGTQGWVLAGLDRAHGASDQYPAKVTTTLADRRNAARERANKAGVKYVSPAQLNDWLQDSTRTTYMLDVRTPEEFASDGSALAVHAPGGQLVQGTDEWIGTRRARVVLIDSDKVRAPMTGYWLAQLGHEVFVLEGGVAAMPQVFGSQTPRYEPSPLNEVAPNSVELDKCQLVDLGASTAFRKQHIDGAKWSIRPSIDRLKLDSAKPVVLVGPQESVSLVAADLIGQGFSSVSYLTGDIEDWQSAGLSVVSSPELPADEDCIDHLFFTAERHTGNEDHSRQYLEWEVNLVNQLDEQERSVFTVTP